MHNTDTQYVPALGYDWLTRLYDPLMALTTRERTFAGRSKLQIVKVITEVLLRLVSSTENVQLLSEPILPHSGLEA